MRENDTQLNAWGPVVSTDGEHISKSKTLESVPTARAFDTSPVTKAKLLPHRVLLIEDEAVVAMVMEEMLLDLGYDVVGPAHTLEAAADIVEHEDFTVALVDVHLHGQSSYPLAETLSARSIPFAFATGEANLANDGFGDTPILHKPFDYNRLRLMVEQLIDRSLERPAVHAPDNLQIGR